MTASQASDIFQPGDLLNNTYRIETILGRGGTSEVYRARSDISGKVMAIKALRAEFASNEDFLVLMTREEDVREIQHDAVVRYFDTQRMADGVVYLVMDYVDGPGLEKKLADGGMSAADLMIVGQRVCEGLIAAHDRNIVHRDLSPDNIILRNDSPGEAVIIDFGIAKDTNPGAETIVGNEFAGKYAYAAPEQLSGQTDARSDIYSLGALLLSTFRGAKPDIGANPMEVVQKKSEALDVEGVPEPLRKMIQRMTHPDPAQRFESAHALLAAFKNPESVEAPSEGAPTPPPAEELDDATVIVPVSTARTEPQPDAIGIPSKASKPAEPSRSGGGILIPVLAALLVIGLGAGGFFLGLFDAVLGPKYPRAEPFALNIQRAADGPARASGNVPDEFFRTELSAYIARQGGQSDLTLATGDISDSWGEAVMLILGELTVLDEYRIAVRNNAVQITGLAASQAELDAVRTAFAQGYPGGLTGSIDLTLSPRFLPPDDVQDLLDLHADCGRLFLAGAPPLGFGDEDRIIVIGRFAHEGTRAMLQEQIGQIAGPRPVQVEGEILNESLCQIDASLPSAAPGGFDLRFGFGDRPDANLSGRYKVGDNPIIDVRIPDTVTDGFLWVSVVDVQGVVFHLLPNRVRPDNSVAALRQDAQNGFVRLAYGLEEAQGTGRIAFSVDGSVLGKSKVLVLHSDNALFPDLRPTTESAASYADALEDARNSGGLYINSMDSAIIVTEP